MPYMVIQLDAGAADLKSAGGGIPPVTISSKPRLAMGLFFLELIGSTSLAASCTSDHDTERSALACARGGGREIFASTLSLGPNSATSPSRISSSLSTASIALGR